MKSTSETTVSGEPRGPGRRRGRYTQAARVLAMLERIRSAGEPVAYAKLTTEFDVSERQLRRDIAALASHGVAPVLFDGRAAAQLARRDETETWTARERELLAALGGVAAMFGDGTVGAELARALAKLSATHVSVRAVPSSSTPGLGARVDAFDAAIRQRCEVRVRLVSDRSERLVPFLPAMLVVSETTLHVVGRWDRTDSIRAVPIDRFAHAEVAAGTTVEELRDLDVTRLFDAPRPSALVTTTT